MFGRKSTKVATPRKSKRVERCDLCGKPIPQDAVYDMWNPSDPEGAPIVCHFQCGYEAGYDPA